MAIKDDFLSVRYDQRNQEGTRKLQVAALQISPIPQVPDRDTRLTERSTSRSYKNAKKKNALVSSKRLAGPGFDFDVDIDDDELSKTPETSITEVNADDEVVTRPSQDAENTKVRRLAGIFMESGKALNVRYNVVNALDKKEMEPGAPNKKQLQISRTTKNRKETVMAVISLKYHWLSKCQEVYSGDAIKYPGVEGVYNPLQIIRNRAIRAKHHEPAPPLPYANLPLACNVFSSHKQAHGKPWKMLWGIELKELINDEAWRAQHWNELRDPNGNLWFPDARPPPHSVISFDTPSKPLKSNRLHDKLWGDVDLEDRGSSRSKSPASKNIRNNIKQKAKRLYGSVSSNGNSTSDVELSSNDVGKSHESLSRQKQSSKSDSDSNGGQIFQFPRNIGSSGSSEGQNAQFELPKIKIDTNPNEVFEDKSESQHVEEHSANRTRPNLDDVQINRLHYNTNLSNSQVLGEPPRSPDIDSKELELLNIFALGQSMELQLTLNEGFLSTVFPHLVESTSTRLEGILNNKINVILHNIVLVNDNQLPAHEAFYTGFLSECKSLMNVINDEYAVKIGHLLSATDRSMGEINTSLSLDMKKVNENLDRVNQSLFGSIVTSSVSDRSVTLTDGGNYKILYFLLENTIVIVLRLTWLVANIFKFFLGILKIIWKLTSILFGI